MTIKISSLDAKPLFVPNMVYVNPSVQKAECYSYHTWEEANNYILNQNPNNNNRWAIYIHGVNNEDIIIHSYITIIGVNNSTILNGSLRSDVSFSIGNFDTSQAKVIGCSINNLNTMDAYEFIQFENCNLANGSPKSGFIQCFNCSISDGDYSNLTIMQLFNCMVVGGIFPTNFTALNSELYSNYRLRGGELTGCLVSNKGGGAVVDLQDNLDLDRCTLNYGFDTSYRQVTMNQCYFKDSPTININSGGSLFTVNCSSDFSVDGELSGWHNSGCYYDNRESGVSLTDTQSVIDRLNFGKGNTREVTASGILNIDFRKTLHKVELTGDITGFNYTGDVDPNEVVNTVLKIKQPEAVNYDVDFSSIKFEKGRVPDIKVNYGMEYLIEISSIGGIKYGKMLSSCPLTVTELNDTEEQIDPASIIPSRDATKNVLDSDLNTSDPVDYMHDKHEYKFVKTRNLKRVELTVTVNQGEGWPSDSNIDFYYIPKGINDISGYVKFATHNYPGMVDWVNYNIVKDLPGDFVEADGVYIVFTGNNIEGGWATFNEFKAYATIEFD